MAYSRFVRPQTDVLTLDNGDTLIVRRRLNVGEEHASFNACREAITQDDGTITREFNATKLQRAKVAAYLVDWQLVDAPSIRELDLADRIRVIENLDPIDFAELRDAINAHEARQFAARLEEKKQARTTNADPTSRSPSDAAGVWSGSASSTPTITPSY